MEMLKQNDLRSACAYYKIARMTPPSTRTAAPFVAEASGLERYTIMLATSSVVAKRCRSDEGRMFLKNSFSKAVESEPFCAPICEMKVSTPSDLVGPARTLFTVMPVPATVSEMPRATATCAVLVMPYG